MNEKVVIYERVNAILTVLSSLCFLGGSFLFLPRFADYSVLGVWLFALGSALMLVTSLQQACSCFTAANQAV